MRIREKMVLKIGLTLLTLALICSTAFAESRSATFRVSCTIVPMLEISAPQIADRTFVPQASMPAVSGETKLELKTVNALITVGACSGKDYFISEILLNKPEGKLKLYSITAL